MKSIQEIYPDFNSWGVGDYQSLLQSFGYEIVLQIDDNDYQGDSRILFKDGARYGLLIFGWGSCSGCDALQACTTLEEIEELRQQLHHDIWWDTAEGLMHYLTEKDWTTEWSWGAQETKAFLEEVKVILQEAIKI